MSVIVVNESELKASVHGLQIRILVVEDNMAFLEFATSILAQQPRFEVVGKVKNGLEAIHQAAHLQPDIVLLDIGLPGLNGIEAARRVRKCAPDSKIVFLSQESSPDVVGEALSLGAWAYVLKAHAYKDLPAALEAVLKGKKFISSPLNGYHRQTSLG